MHRDIWVQSTKDRFNQLILFGESQPSNGTVRKIDPPNGATRFAVAYGTVPDNGIRVLLVFTPLVLILIEVWVLTLTSGKHLRQA